MNPSLHSKCRLQSLFIGMALLMFSFPSARSQPISPDEIAPGGNFSGKDLSGVKLGGKDLEGVDFRNAKLISVDLHKAILTRANLVGADLSKSDLTGATLLSAGLQGANFAGAKLEDVDLGNAVYDLKTQWPEGFVPEEHGGMLAAEGQNLSEKDWSNRNLTAALLSNVNFKKTKLIGANLGRAVLMNANLTDADLSNAILMGASLQGANLKGANLANVDLKTVIYDGATQWPAGFDPGEGGAAGTAPKITTLPGAETPASAQRFSKPPGDASQKTDLAQLMKSAATLANQKKYGEARKLYDQVIAESPDSALGSDAFQKKATSYQSEGNAKDAEGVFKEALAHHPRNAANWLYNLAYVQGLQTKYDEAYRNFDRVLKEFPKDPLVPTVYYQIGFFKKTQQEFLKAIEAYLAMIPNLPKVDATGRLATQEISNCLQLLDMPIEKARWDRFVAGGFKGENSLNLERLKQKQWPVKHHSPEYLSSVQRALDAPSDIWGEELMKRPEGPTYENMKDLLEPLQLVHASFRYYHLLLSTKEGKFKARLAGNGNQIGVGLRKDRLENAVWMLPDVAVRFFVGEKQERFGDDDTRRVGPLPLKGYLPIYTTEYTLDGKKYVQQVLSEGTDPFVVKVAVTVPPGGDLSILVENQRGATEVQGNQIANSKKQILCSIQNGAIKRDTEFPQFSWVRVTPKDQPETVYLSIPYWPAQDLKAPDASAFNQAVQSVSTYWDDILAKGARIDVPETTVMNAWRSTLISNFSLIQPDMMFYNANRERLMLYSFGCYYETFYPYEATRPFVAFSLYGFHEDALRYFDTGSQVPNEDWGTASQPWTAYELYLLGDSTQFVRERLKRFQDNVDELNDGWKKSPKKLQPAGGYAGDIGHIQVYSLDHNLGAYRAVRDFGLMLKDMGDTSKGEQYYKDSQEYRKHILKAIEESIDHRSNPPFIPQSLYGDEKAYAHLSDDVVGSYYNIVASRVQDTGVFGPHDKLMDMLNGFLEQRGGRILGLLRFNQHSSLYVGEGVDDTYQIEYSRSLLLRDEIDRFLVSFYGKLAHGMTRDTFVGAEILQVAPVDGEGGRRLYMPPNSTTNSHFLHNLRHMLVLEEDENVDGIHNRLNLLKGTPRAWLAPGKHIAFSHLPTYFGPISASLEVSKDGKAISGEIEVPSKRPAGKVILRLRRPIGFTLKEVTVNGESLKKFDASKEEIDLSGFKGKVTLLAKYS